MSKQIHVGSVPVGGGADIAIQSMCNTRTEDVAATVAQILRLEEAGCDIIRVAVPDMAAAQAVGRIRRAIHIPLVADIHFDYKLALECVRQGIDKIRINPGNIGSQEKVRAVADACRGAGHPHPHRCQRRLTGAGTAAKIRRRHPGGAGGECHGPCPPAERLQFRRHLHLREVLLCAGEHGGLPAAAPTERITPCIWESQRRARPRMGVLKSAIGIGGLLCQGIGDTIRVCLTADPVEEVRAAKDILSAAGLRQTGPNLISCPTCGRTKYDMIPIAREVERRLEGCDQAHHRGGDGVRGQRPRRGPCGGRGHRRRRRRGSGVL